MLVLLPCYSLEDFSLYRSADEAREIFASISAFYHPALLEFFGKLPDWEPAGSPSDYQDHRLILIPPCCESLIPKDWLQKMVEKEAFLIRDCSDRKMILEKALAFIDQKDPPFSEDITESFLAMGLAWFVSELLSRKLRYMSDIDLTELEKNALAAVKAFRENKPEAGNEELQKGYDLICEANEYYFPTPPKFLDLTRWTPEDSAESLKEMILKRKDREEKTNLFLPLDTLDALLKTDSSLADLMKEELENGRLQLIGSDRSEPLYLMPQFEIYHRLKEVLDDYKSRLDYLPSVYQRTNAGYSPALPRLLRLAGWKGILLFTSDGWKPDHQEQDRLQWKGADGTLLPAIAQEPLDGEDDAVFMEQLDRMGYSYSATDIMTLLFAHRPGKEIEVLGDIARFNRFDPILGQTVGIGDYFEETEKSGSVVEMEKDDFRTNFLTRSPDPDPISFWGNFYQNHFRSMAKNAFALMDHFSEKREKSKEKDGDLLLRNGSPTEKKLVLEGKPASIAEPLTARTRTVLDDQGKSFTLFTLPPFSQWKVRMDSNEEHCSGENLNPSSAKPSFWKKTVDFLRGKKTESDKKMEMIEFVEEPLNRNEIHRYYAIRNEYFELRIDPATGELRRLQVFGKESLEIQRGLIRQPGRGNRFAFQLGLRLSPEQQKADPRDRKDGNFGYTIMSADQITLLENGPLVGRISISGRLMMPDGEIAAKFREILTVRRGSRIVNVKISFNPKILPDGHRWDHYYGCRFAWKDRLAEIRTGLHEMLWRTEKDYVQGPEAVDIRSEQKIGITLLTRGYPFFRRYGMNRMDSVWITKDESERNFEFGIGVDLVQPIIPSALGFLAPDPEILPVVSDSHFSDLQLFSFEKKSGDRQTVIPVELVPIFEERSVLLTLQETTGKKDHLRFKPSFSFRKAMFLDLEEKGPIWKDLPVDSDGFLDLDAGKYQMIPIRFEEISL
ncbi:MAG: hypothetical protein Q4G69_08420 [Planctomycetia bacterium]|nr:hypothetical protein [Planctomycetia bacterium]